ncbi:hypothetical protein [Pseudoalteromonas sp. MTN2-4]|uniref:hypothetical protein n=1 Tax=Pseudoalteromonas sp. MTN2-4 TaxID=3056555 RepID=UPI0036F25653
MERKFINHIQDQIDSAFVAINYKRPRRSCCYFELSPNVYSWHGMPCDSRGQEAIYYKLNIGLHFRDIEETARKYSGLKYKVGEGVTIMENFQTVLGEKYKLFTFDPKEPENIEPEIERLISLVQTHASRWYERNNNIEVVTEFLKSNIERLGFYPERYAVALKMQKQNKVLQEFLEQHSETVKLYGNDIEQNWINFGNNLKVT